MCLIDSFEQDFMGVLHIKVNKGYWQKKKFGNLCFREWCAI